MVEGLIEIVAEGQVAEVSRLGGIVRRYGADLGGRTREVLYCPPGSEPTLTAPCFFGNWALLPFANRAFGGVVDDGTVRFEVPKNDPKAGGAIHGFGWQSVWDVESVAADRVVLVHERREGPDPYRYLCRQTIAVGAEGLRIDLAIENRAEATLPYGIAQHPWFPLDAETTLRLSANGMLRVGEAYRPLGHGPIPPEADLSSDTRVAAPFERIHNYTGWDGTAVIRYPAERRRVVLSSERSMDSPLLWAPVGADFFCLEPMSHVIGAPTDPVARAVTPLKRLAPGESLAGWMTIRQEADD